MVNLKPSENGKRCAEDDHKYFESFDLPIVSSFARSVNQAYDTYEAVKRVAMLNKDRNSVAMAKDNYFNLCERYSKRLILAILIHLYICQRMGMTAFNYFVSCTSDPHQKLLQQDVHTMMNIVIFH